MNKAFTTVLLLAAAVAVQAKFIPEIQDAIVRYPQLLKNHGGIVLGMGRNVGSNGNKIVGGNVAKPGDFPHQCHLRITTPQGDSFCGCSIISDSWILTAAHCTSGSTAITVTMGDHDLDAVEGTEVTRVAIKNITHENYGSIIIRNDVAVIQIDPVPLNDNIKAICLANGTETYAGRNATVSGWGKENDNSTTVARQLSYIDVQVIPNSECVSAYSALTVTGNNICTSIVGDKGTCQGDSGGPLIIKNANTGKLEQIGIVSFGSNAGCTKAPSAYARVTSFLDWIVKSVGADVVNVGC